jgi:hypothetical protein
MIPLEEIETIKSDDPKRVLIKDLSAERLESFRDATIDFCRRSKSLVQPMHSWAYISRILNGKEDADVWWSFDGEKVNGFSVIKLYQDFDGQWTAYVQFGWSDSSDAKNHLKFIISDYIRKGINRIQFSTRRSPLVFKRWLGQPWEIVGTLFERR